MDYPAYIILRAPGSDNICQRWQAPGSQEGNYWQCMEDLGHWQHDLQSPDLEVETWNNAARHIAVSTHYAGRPTYLFFSVKPADLKSNILGC